MLSEKLMNPNLDSYDSERRVSHLLFRLSKLWNTNLLRVYVRGEKVYSLQKYLRDGRGEADLTTENIQRLVRHWMFVQSSMFGAAVSKLGANPGAGQ